MECKFGDIKHIDKNLLEKVWSLLYRINDDQMIISIDNKGICLMRELPSGNYLEIYPTTDEVIWRVYDHSTELIKQKIFKW